MALQEDTRAACVTTLEAYATANSVALQVYRARPRSLKPPTAFVDKLTEGIDYTGRQMARTVTATVVLVHGLFDSGEAVDQRDPFIDGYIEYVRSLLESAPAGPNTTFGVTATDDDPEWVPTWLPIAEQRTYYATLLTLEGYTGQ